MIVPPDDFSPIAVGDTGAPFAPVFTTLDANNNVIAYNLSAITSLTSKATTEEGVVKTWGGTWTIDDTANGKAHYSYVAGDVDTPGVWTIHTTLFAGSLPVHTQKKTLVIELAP